jgi:PAS domain-containing protein
MSEAGNGTSPRARSFGRKNNIGCLDLGPDEFLPSYERFMASVHQEDRQASAQVAEETRRPAMKATGIEVRIILPNGETRLLHTLGRTVLNNAGKIVRIVGTSRTSPSAVRRIKNSRLCLESAPDAIIIVRCDGSIMLVNSQAEKIFGYQR